MPVLNVFAKFADGSPAADQLVTLTTANGNDWFKPGMPIFTNPRRTSGDGGVNFYSGGRLPAPVSVQATCQNGTSDPVQFDGSADVVIQLTVIPFV